MEIFNKKDEAQVRGYFDVYANKAIDAYRKKILASLEKLRIEHSGDKKLLHKDGETEGYENGLIDAIRVIRNLLSQ